MQYAIPSSIEIHVSYADRGNIDEETKRHDKDAVYNSFNRKSNLYHCQVLTPIKPYLKRSMEFGPGASQIYQGC